MYGDCATERERQIRLDHLYIETDNGGIIQLPSAELEEASQLKQQTLFPKTTPLFG
jgi:hypothetical protein